VIYITDIDTLSLHYTLLFSLFIAHVIIFLLLQYYSYAITCFFRHIDNTIIVIIHLYSFFIATSFRLYAFAICFHDFIIIIAITTYYYAFTLLFDTQYFFNIFILPAYFFFFFHLFFAIMPLLFFFSFRHSAFHYLLLPLLRHWIDIDDCHCYTCHMPFHYNIIFTRLLAIIITSISWFSPYYVLPLIAIIIANNISCCHATAVITPYTFHLLRCHY